MSEYTFRDLILDRKRGPAYTTRYELITWFEDGHEFPKRRFATEQEAKDCVDKLWRENRLGYRKDGQWVTARLISCAYTPVRVPMLFISR